MSFLQDKSVPFLGCALREANKEKLRKPWQCLTTFVGQDIIMFGFVAISFPVNGIMPQGASGGLSGQTDQV